MIAPFSMNFENETVPMNDIIAISKITSMKNTVSNKIDSNAIIEISITPIPSKAMSRSGVDGPLNTRMSVPRMHKKMMIKQTHMKIFMFDSPP